MNDEYINLLWERISSATNIKCLEYGEAVTIGSVFGEMKAEIKKLRQKVNEMEENKKEGLPMNMESFISLKLEQEKELGLRVLKYVPNKKRSEIIILAKRYFDNTHIVWESYCVDGQFFGFYNGAYDMTLEQANEEMERRLQKGI